MKMLLLVAKFVISTLSASAQNTELLLRSYINLKEALVNSVLS